MSHNDDNNKLEKNPLPEDIRSLFANIQTQLADFQNFLQSVRHSSTPSSTLSADAYFNLSRRSQQKS